MLAIVGIVVVVCRTLRSLLGGGRAPDALGEDRASAARRSLHANSVRPEQIVEIRGFADRNFKTAGSRW